MDSIQRLGIFGCLARSRIGSNLVVGVGFASQITNAVRGGGPYPNIEPAQDGICGRRTEFAVQPNSGWIYPSVIRLSSFCGSRPIGSVVQADGHRHGVSNLEFALADPA